MKKIFSIVLGLMVACAAAFANNFSDTIDTVINQFDEKESVTRFLKLADNLFIYDSEYGYYINNAVLTDLVTLENDADVKDFCEIINKLFLIDEKCENFPKDLVILDADSDEEKISLSDIRDSLNAERNDKNNKLKNLSKSKAKPKALTSELFPYTKQWNYHKNYELICQLFVLYNITHADAVAEE